MKRSVQIDTMIKKKASTLFVSIIRELTDTGYIIQIQCRNAAYENSWE